MLKTVLCCRLEEEADRADRGAAIAEEEAKRYKSLNYLNHTLYLWTVLFCSELLPVLLFCSEPIVSCDIETLILRLEKELVQKEAADAAMAREKEVLG